MNLHGGSVEGPDGIYSEDSSYCLTSAIVLLFVYMISSYKNVEPIIGAKISMMTSLFNYCLKTPPPSATTLGDRASQCTLWTSAKLQSMILFWTEIEPVESCLLYWQHYHQMYIAWRSRKLQVYWLQVLEDNVYCWHGRFRKSRKEEKYSSYTLKTWLNLCTENRVLMTAEIQLKKIKPECRFQ